MFYLCAGSLIVVYVLFSTLLASPFGRVAVAIRHNEISAPALSATTPRPSSSALFVIGAGVAGYAGCLFANWNAFISPNVFGLPMMAQTIIWVVVGGLRTLTGPILGAIALQYLATILGSNSGFNVNMTLGLILMAIVVLLPEGIVPTALRGARWLVRLRLAAAPSAGAERGGATVARGGVRRAMTPALQVHNVSMQFGGVTAIKRR